MRLFLPALCEALRANGVRIVIEPSGRCSAQPSHQLTPAMIDALKYYKPEIIRVLRRRDEIVIVELTHCRRCGTSVTPSASELCGGCEQKKHVVIEMEPNSPAEVAYLRDLENWQQLSPTVPVSVKSSETSIRGQLGIVGTVHTGAHTYARA